MLVRVLTSGGVDGDMDADMGNLLYLDGISIIASCLKYHSPAGGITTVELSMGSALSDSISHLI